MYNRTKKIPTIIALLILIIGIGGGIFLLENRPSSSSKATGSSEPQSILITNLSDTSFSVTWLTSQPLPGSLTYRSKNSTDQVALDDRDVDITDKPKSYLTHHITVRNLTPATNYEFTIISGDKNYQDAGKPYSVTTAPKLETGSSLEPAYGQVTNSQNQPAEGALVIINLPQSLPLSTLVKASGNWLIPLNMARSIDLKPYSSSSIIPVSIDIFSTVDEKAHAITDTNNDSPVPPITLGKTYNFQGLQGKKASGEQIASQNQEKNILGKETEKKVDIIAPTEGSSLVSNRPLIRGKGIPNKEVIIKIESTQTITGKTTVDANGLWSWTPPKDLSPDKHKITITTTDENGNKVILERNFLVFKSGTQVLGEATPSGTITSTPSPTGKITPSPGTGGGSSPSATLKPLMTGSPTPSKMPVSGNVSNTIIFVGVGMILIIVGFAKLLFSV